MNYFKQIDWKPVTIIKIIGIALFVVVALSFSARMLGSSFDSLTGVSTQSLRGAVGIGDYAMDEEFAAKESYYGGEDGVNLSVRNVAPQPPASEPSSGTTAEDFEITDYNADIESRDIKKACGVISDLKKRDDVIFERANEYREGCSYTFKVEKEKNAEILALIEGLKPTELSENTRTIKRRIDDFTSREEILLRKQESIESTFEEAISAYEEITLIARKSQNADALASIIDSKVRIIERLSQERINISTQLDQLSRSKADQLDRLAYTYFHVNISENKYIDGVRLKDSWKFAIKEFVRDVNTTLQKVTIGLISLVFIIAQFALYSFILLITVKYSWKVAKDVWRK